MIKANNSLVSPSCYTKRPTYSQSIVEVYGYHTNPNNIHLNERCSNYKRTKGLRRGIIVIHGWWPQMNRSILWWGQCEFFILLAYVCALEKFVTHWYVFLLPLCSITQLFSEFRLWNPGNPKDPFSLGWYVQWWHKSSDPKTTVTLSRIKVAVKNYVNSSLVIILFIALFSQT